MLNPPLKFDQNGLIPAVVQDARSLQVLMVAWMNEESLRLTQETAETHFWSRSRQELWHKGATSGNVQMCAKSASTAIATPYLYLVDPAGPACHTRNNKLLLSHPIPQHNKKRNEMNNNGTAKPFHSNPLRNSLHLHFNHPITNFNKGNPMNNEINELFLTLQDRKLNPQPDPIPTNFFLPAKMKSSKRSAKKPSK